MTDLPRLRVHPTLGVAMRWPGQEHWWVMLGNGDTPQRLSDVAVRGQAWRELRVGEAEDGGMTDEQHLIRFTYTTDDDGVWLECSCGWQENLEFYGTPERAMELASAHRAAEGT